MLPQSSSSLRVDNPCPMLLRRMSEQGPDFHCKSCAKTVIDFRGKSRDEICQSITSDTCGIFTVRQLPGQRKAPFIRRTAFLFLTLLSFLGFSVSPVQAQPAKAIGKPDSAYAQPDPKPALRRKKKARKKDSCDKPARRGLFRKKKKEYRVIGTPSF